MTNYAPYIVILFFLLMVIAIWFLLRLIKKRKNKKQQIPQDVLETFNRAEELLRTHQGQMTPQEILWKLYNERGNVHPETLPTMEEEQNQIKHIEKEKPKSRLSNLFNRRKGGNQ